MDKENENEYEMTPTEIREQEERSNAWAEEYVRKAPEPYVPPETREEWWIKTIRMEGKLKRARSRTDSNNSDDIENTNTTKKTKTITDSNNTAWTKYFIIESKHSEGTTLDRLSPFAVQKYVTTLVGDVHMVKKTEIRQPAGRSRWSKTVYKNNKHQSIWRSRIESVCAQVSQFQEGSHPVIRTQRHDGGRTSKGIERQGCNRSKKNSGNEKWQKRKYEYHHFDFRHTQTTRIHHGWLPQAGRISVFSKSTPLLQVPTIWTP